MKVGIFSPIGMDSFPSRTASAICTSIVASGVTCIALTVTFGCAAALAGGPSTEANTPPGFTFSRRSSAVDAERDGRKFLYHTFDKRRAHRAKRFNFAPNGELANRLTDLNSDRSIGVRYDAIEICADNRAGVDVESASARPKSFNGGPLL
jgi:hypothetical protein